MTPRARILSISFSEYRADARVLRQLHVLADYGDVTTIGYGQRPADAAQHLEIDESLPSLPQTPLGVLKLALRRFSSVVLDSPANVAALALLEGHRFDLVVANEARALPLALRVANGAPVWCDLHEWAPAERTHVLSWRILVAPFMRWLCATYLPAAAATTTVNRSIATMYDEQFGLHTEVVRNAIGLQDLHPSETEPDRIRLVHSGAAVPGRSLETLIDATLALDDRFTLDLYLIRARDGGRYFEQLRRLAGSSARITFHDAVAPHELPATLNRYDVGVFVLPPHTVNHRFMLPNKFFDFVQARLAIVFSPSAETSALIEQYDLGVVTGGFGTADLVTALEGLTIDAVASFKAHADAAAPALSSSVDESVQRGIISRLLSVPA